MKRPNILWILSDDHCPELGCYGTPHVQTPHIDRLAKTGIRFTQAFTTAPVCSASRSAMITGRYQTSINAHHHRSNREQERPADLPILPELFKQAGYHCSLIHNLGMNAIPKTDWNFKTQAEVFDGNDWRQRAPGQPFFAMMNIFEPHRPFAQPIDSPINPDEVEVPPYYPDHPLARRDWASYLQAINRLDYKVGQVLDRLESDGLAEDTIVIFMGDNGRPFPRCKQFLYDGGIHVPLIIRAPGYDVQGQVIDDLVSGIDIAPTLLGLAGIDIPATMNGRDLFNPWQSPPEYIFAARDRCDETVDRIRCVRSKRWKYLRNFFPERAYTQHNQYKEDFYPILGLMRELNADGKLTAPQAAFMAPTRPAEELYDLEADPHELVNLAESKKHRKQLKKMRRQLDRWIQSTGDMGAFKETGS